MGKIIFKRAICLHTVKWFQVLLSNTNSFICRLLNSFKYCYIIRIILFNINVFKSSKWLDNSIWPINGTLTGKHWVKVELGVMAMKEYSTFSKAPGLESHYQIQFSVLSRTLVRRSLTPLQRCSWRFVRPQPSRLSFFWVRLLSCVSY